MLWLVCIRYPFSCPTILIGHSRFFVTVLDHNERNERTFALESAFRKCYKKKKCLTFQNLYIKRFKEEGI